MSGLTIWALGRADPFCLPCGWGPQQDEGWDSGGACVPSSGAWAGRLMSLGFAFPTCLIWGYTERPPRRSAGVPASRRGNVTRRHGDRVKAGRQCVQTDNYHHTI